MSLYSLPHHQHDTRPSTTELIRELLSEITELFHQYVTFTRASVREEGQRLAKAIIFGAIALMFLQVTLIFIGNLLLLSMVVQQVNLVAATVLTMGLFLLLTVVFGFLCVKQLQDARDIMKPKT